MLVCGRGVELLVMEDKRRIKGQYNAFSLYSLSMLISYDFPCSHDFALYYITKYPHARTD